MLPSRFSVRIGIGLLVGAVLWAGSPAAAQTTRTLDIRDGKIYVDGRRLTDDQIPPGLSLDGVTAHYQFVGIQRPVVELAGRLVALADSGLTPVTGSEVQAADASVVLQGGTARAGTAPPAAEGEQSAHQQYLHDMQQSSRKLYERLQHEQHMEGRVQDLARVIRMLPEGDARRQAKVDTLRAMLGRLFELKQENHRREIKRLQREIQELQRRLRKREEMRQAMIEHRLQQLIGESPNP